jgi:hypothetical protein
MTEATQRETRKLLNQVPENALSAFVEVLAANHRQIGRKPIGGRHPGIRGEILCYMEAMSDADRESVIVGLSRLVPGACCMV